MRESPQIFPYLKTASLSIQTLSVMGIPRCHNTSIRHYDYLLLLPPPVIVISLSGWIFLY